MTNEVLERKEKNQTQQQLDKLEKQEEKVVEKKETEIELI